MKIKNKLDERFFDSRKNKYVFDRKSLLASALTFLSFVAVGFFVCLATETMADFYFVNVIFTVLWSLFFCAVIFVLPKRAARVVYCVLYFFLLFYGVGQYIYFKIFNKVFSFTVLSNVGEGAGYWNTVFQYVGPWQAIFFILLVILGVFVALHVKDIVPFPPLTRILAIPALIVLIAISQVTLPRALGEKSEDAVWNSFEDRRYVYENYTNPHKCMGYVGYYQFLCLDFYNCFIRDISADKSELENSISEFFTEYPSSCEDNEMTGLFEGKNAVIIMMESVDYLAISEEYTPNIYKMMNEGISFENYYSSIFGDGATFANEFVMNTGIYAPSNGTAPYQYVKNTFSESLPNLFKDKGYSVNSFHKNHGWFYNRLLMHERFGYESYNSFYEYNDDTDTVNIDTMLTDTPELTEKLLGGMGEEGQPFMSFLITYSAHLPYEYDNEIYEYAKEKYQIEEPLSESEDLDVLRAKAKITDDMIGRLAQAADENTVFICVTDHFCYGLDEETQLEYKSDIWALRQRSPFFIWSKDPETPQLKVNKLCSNSDFLPTVANLFGLDIPKNLLGSDIFSENYEGFVIFSNYTWLTPYAYWADGEVVVKFGDYTDEQVGEMTSYMYRRIKANDNILLADYYNGY